MFFKYLGNVQALSFLKYWEVQILRDLKVQVLRDLVLFNFPSVLTTAKAQILLFFPVLLFICHVECFFHRK